MSEELEKTKSPKLNDEMVAEYLQDNPDFFRNNADVLENIALPSAGEGKKILDFQSFAIKQLQDNIRHTKEQFNDLICSARDNNSVQMQVHKAILKLVRAKHLEPLLETITIDFVQLFNVDVVRLAMESDIAEIYDTNYPDDNYSGVVFIESGIADIMLGENGSALICEDIQDHDIFGIEQVFTECEWLVRSCIVLRLQLRNAQKPVLLAFGAREKNHFNSGQAIDLLAFLGEIVEECLDICLKQTEMDEII